jgi:hypothetical protein
MLYEHADQRGFKGLQVSVCIRSDQPGALEEKTMNSLSRTAAAFGFAIAAAAAFPAAQAQATTFAAWEVANVAFGDTLNVRKYPAAIRLSERHGAADDRQMHRRAEPARHRHAAGVEAAAAGPLPVVRSLARSGAEWQFRHRLGLWQIHNPLLSDLSTQGGQRLDP